MLNFSSFKEKYNSRTEREKKLLLLIAVVILFALTLSFLKSLPELFRPSLRSQVEVQQAKFELLLPKISEMQQLKQVVQSYHSANQADISQFIEKNKPNLNSLENDAIVITKKGKGAEIEYQAVSFDDLIIWLQRLQKQNGIAVVSANITPLPEDQGFVAANITLE